MNQGKYVFSQLIDFLPKVKFDWFVKKYEGNKYVKKFTCWNHLLVMIFAQLTQRESLRDLVSVLNAHKSKFNRLGFGENVLNKISAFFVVREKRRMAYEVVLDKECNNTETGVMADQNIKFTGYKTRKQYPNEMRRVVFYDHESNTTFVFYTNNFDLSAENIALAYK